MQTILESIDHYLSEVLEKPAACLIWDGENSLPSFLRSSYSFYETTLLGVKCLLMVAKPGAELSPSAIQKHADKLERRSAGMVIFVQEGIAPYNRKRLVQKRVSFIDPGTSLYLPSLAIEFKERSNKPKQRLVSQKPLTPSAQVILFYCLLAESLKHHSISMLHQELGYTRMTITRVFNELESHKIGETFTKNRERFWAFDGSKKELWDLIKPFLRNPIKRRLWIKNQTLHLLSGQSALSIYTQLAPSKLPTYALSSKDLSLDEMEQVPIADGADLELEIWHYDPLLLSKESAVDIFSLYMIFASSQDERIQQALDEMMEKFIW